jgi:hypothetical protein
MATAALLPLLSLLLCWGATLALTTAKAHAGACSSQTCTCDRDCSGLICSSDPAMFPGRCCGPPVMLGTPCNGGGGSSGSGGTSGDGGGGSGGGDGGGCRVAGGGAAAATATRGLVAGVLLALAALIRPRRPRG